MDKGLIPRRYAKALYEVAAERKTDKALYGLMQTLASTFAATPALVTTVANPFVATSDKESLITEAAGGEDARSNDTFRDFVKLLAQNRRLDMAWDIARAYVDIYRSAHKIYRVMIESAAPLTDQEKARLEAVVAKHVGDGTMEYDYRINPALIGGFTVTVNSERLDASVANTLKQLRLHLIE